MSKQIRRSGILLPLLTLATGAAFAGTVGQSSVPIGSGFASVCAGSQFFGSLPNPGDPLPVSDQYLNCAVSYGPLVSVTNTTPYNGNAMNNTASAAGGPGVLSIDASSVDAAGIPFGGVAAYAGWNDQMTITGGSGGGLWVVPVDIDATLTASQPGSLSRLGITAYENYSVLQPYGGGAASYNLFVSKNGGSGNLRNSAIAFGWDDQALWFGAVNYGADPSTLPSYTVNRTVYFVFPFTYGVPFEFGIYMGGVAGQIGSGSANNSAFDPPSLSWGGAGVVADPNNPASTTTNFTLTSQSGYNYTVAATPEPASAGMMLLAGICAAAAGLRRRARS